MAKVFVSFLGTGHPKKEPIGYELAAYNWPGKSEAPIVVSFVQTAMLKILEERAGEEGPVDRVIILCTEESQKKHKQALQDELIRLSLLVDFIIPDPLVPTDMTANNQWGWFEQLLEIVEPNDTLVIDFTHGPRSVQLVLSSGISFLQRAKGITLAHALYGWYAPDTKNPDKVHPIVDMRDFYVINDWADAVARLADDADARKLGELASSTQIEALQPLADENLIRAFEEMTDCIRNVDVNNVGKKVSAALDRVEQARKRVSGSALVMLDLVWRKFSTLATDYPPSGRYDLAYFKSQLEVIRVLLEHRLFMQAFTAMREFIGSLGMVGVSGKYKKNMYSSDGRKYRKRFAEIFVRMLSNPEGEWIFIDSENEAKDLLLPWFEELEKKGIGPRLRAVIGPMTDTRNGFAHAWTAKAGAQKDIEAKGQEYFSLLESIITQLAERQLIA